MWEGGKKRAAEREWGERRNERGREGREREGKQ